MLKKITDFFLNRETRELLPEVLAANAQGILNNPAYDAAREAILKRAIAEWIATRPDEVSKREQLYNQLLALGKIQAELNLLVQTNNKDNG